MRHKNKYLIGLILTLNLIFSVSGTLAQSISSGSVDVNACISDCLALSAPNTLNIANTPLFFNNQQKRIYLYSNYDLGQQVMVNDARVNGQFMLDVNISELTHTTNSNAIIPLDNIGILTFNNSSSSSLDGYNGDGFSVPESNLDPVYRGETTEPFSQNELLALISASAPFDNYFINFSGSGPTSTALNLISANTDPSYLGRYSFGLGLVINLPDNAINDFQLTNGTYQGDITFTLTEL